MALRHHWKFSNNLQDSVGDVHLTNVVGTPAYGNNKDGVANSCMDNSVPWRAHSNLTSEFGEMQRSYSFWTASHKDSEKTIFQDRMFYIERDYYARNIIVYYRSTEDWNTLGATDLKGPYTVSEEINGWVFVCITINNNGVKKLFINGILKAISTNTIAPFDGAYITCVNAKYRNFPTPSLIENPSKVNLDEIKYFDHILTDGGVTAIGQPASLDSEVWQLYISGVNNIPAYTLNPATEITGTSAKLNWNES